MTKPTKEITMEEDNCNHPSDGIIRDSKEILKCSKCGKELNDLLRNKDQQNEAISKMESTELIALCDCVTPRPDAEYGVCGRCGNNLVLNKK